MAAREAHSRTEKIWLGGRVASLQDLHLATRHGGDRGVVRSGGDAGAQGGIHRERDLGQVRLDGEGIADHADVGA